MTFLDDVDKMIGLIYRVVFTFDFRQLYESTRSQLFIADVISFSCFPQQEGRCI